MVYKLTRLTINAADAYALDASSTKAARRIKIMARGKKVDANQSKIVNALRSVGCSVAITSSAGDGFPDLVVGCCGRNILMEVKDGDKPPSKQKLTQDQEVFHGNWRGQIAVINSVDQALAVLDLHPAYAIWLKSRYG